MADPIKAAREAVAVAADAVQRAQVYVDYQGKTPAYEALSTMCLSLVEFLRELQRIEANE